jgi:hypothetical protein
VNDLSKAESAQRWKKGERVERVLRLERVGERVSGLKYCSESRLCQQVPQCGNIIPGLSRELLTPPQYLEILIERLSGVLS